MWGAWWLRGEGGGAAGQVVQSRGWSLAAVVEGFWSLVDGLAFL